MRCPHGRGQYNTSYPHPTSSQQQPLCHIEQAAKTQPHTWRQHHTPGGGGAKASKVDTNHNKQHLALNNSANLAIGRILLLPVLAWRVAKAEAQVCVPLREPGLGPRPLRGSQHEIPR
jgi:hypothetical protein